MVRNYKRKSERGKWTEEAMRQAVEAVIERKMGYFKAAKTFSVPQTTLERKVQAARAIPNENRPIKVPLGPKSPVFSVAEENELCDYLIEMEERLYGLTTKDLKRLVYQLAVKNNKPNPFNAEKEEAGRDWISGFLKRHPQLSIRKPESTSAARASGFNKVAVEKFFNFLGNVYDEHQLTPDRVYNCDETGVSVVPKTKSKIVAKRGRKQVGAIVSADRGQTITVEICFSAAGNYMPPMLVFPRKRMNPELMANSQAGCWGTCSESGWMTSELFLEWFKRFVTFSGASVERPVLLLLDGHSTHTQNIDLIIKARTHGVIILCFPPHTTHRLQVADVAFMRPLSIYYDQAVTAWLRSNPGLVVTIRQVAEILGKAFVQTANMATAVNGFQKCGIWPYNPNVFSESDFAPSLTTEIQFKDNQALPSTSHDSQVVVSTTASVTQGTSTTTDMDASNITVASVTTAAPIIDDPMMPTTPTNIHNDPQEGCSHWVDQSNVMLISQQQESPQSIQTPNEPFRDKTNFELVSPKQLAAPPVTRKTIRAVRKRGKTAIITSSPYKKELEKAVQKKKDTENKKKERIEMKTKIAELKKKSTKAKKLSKKNQGKKVMKRSKESSSESGEEDDTPCLYCKEPYSESTEGWISCMSCGKWAHCSCAGVDDDDDEAVHVCGLCQPK